MAMAGAPMIMPMAKAVISRPAWETLTPRSPASSGSRPAMTNSVVPIRNVPAASTQTTAGSLPGVARCPWGYLLRGLAVVAGSGRAAVAAARTGRTRLRSGGEQGLDGAPLVHGPVALGDLLQGQGEVEDLAGLDAAGEDPVDQVGQEAAHGRGAAAQPGV